MTPPATIPRVLSIAGSDSGGGAGIQADLKAFAACEVHGMTAITAITAQNTVAVTAVHAVPPEVILAQVEAVAQDIGVDAVKIGMLGNEATIRAVARALDVLPAGTPVVLDPVMVSESGAELLEVSARDALVALLLPRATVVTPNLPEARALAGAAADVEAMAPAHAVIEAAFSREDGEPTPEALARAIRDLGAEVVVVTGGHRETATDVFFDGSRVVEIPGPRHPGADAHGSGCTHSSALAARLAWGDDPLTAAFAAKEIAARAVGAGLSSIGAGPGPVNVLGLGLSRIHNNF
jgi:hydroxymethylpyrimidine/phosphomethylpyrimidine kinase